MNLQIEQGNWVEEPSNLEPMGVGAIEVEIKLHPD